MLRKRKRLTEMDDDDPMASLTNLSDAMLVLALGFLIFAILALSANPNIQSETSQQSQQSQNTQQISTGETFTNDTTASGSSSGQGYSEVGKVYKDPDTGKLVMVSS
ncbi:DUF2149 domain-containing protein [Methanobrevibacter sp. UBA417]|uniref:DUF2149 domain-containing protein n=1 Tax=Methanobrevibacter sp. UBA417 TaxID=1915487 RepID=UPI0039B86DEC